MSNISMVYGILSKPPSTLNACPVIVLPKSEHRYPIMLAI